MPNYYGSVITETIHPFGRGASNVATLSTGVQYGLTISSAGSTSWANVENVQVSLPLNAIIKQLEFGITAGLLIKTTTTDTISFRVLVQDVTGASTDPAPSTSYDVIASSTASLTASSTNFTDYTFSKRATPSDGTYFTGKSSFNIVGQVASSATTSNAAGGIKNSSYITCKYYLVG